MKGLEVGAGRPVVVKPLPVVEDTDNDVAGILISKLVVDDRLLERIPGAPLEELEYDADVDEEMLPYITVVVR
jgi:hypothetical protein